jgi:hypothetical protein
MWQPSPRARYSSLIDPIEFNRTSTKNSSIPHIHDLTQKGSSIMEVIIARILSPINRNLLCYGYRITWVAPSGMRLLFVFILLLGFIAFELRLITFEWKDGWNAKPAEVQQDEETDAEYYYEE